MIERLTPKDRAQYEVLHEKVFKERAPRFDEATILVEKQDDRIMGMLSVTYVPVVTSVYVRPEARVTGLFRRLIGAAFQAFPDTKVAFTFTRDSKVKRLFSLMGLKDEGFVSSWRKE